MHDAFVWGLVLLALTCFLPPLARRIDSPEVRAYLSVIDLSLTIVSLYLMIVGLGTVVGGIVVALSYIVLSAVYFSVVTADGTYVNPYTRNVWPKDDESA